LKAVSGIGAEIGLTVDGDFDARCRSYDQAELAGARSRETQGYVLQDSSVAVGIRAILDDVFGLHTHFRGQRMSELPVTRQCVLCGCASAPPSERLVKSDGEPRAPPPPQIGRFYSCIECGYSERTA
jgi:hypothetical protein